MKRIRNNTLAGLLMAILFNAISYSVSAQSDPTSIDNKKVTATILHLDSLFWKSYNDCKPEDGGLFLTDDVKFYHDKGGITNGKSALVASIRDNVCGSQNPHLRREAVEGTVHVYPLRNGNTIYGAIISGEHVFYVTEKNKPERKDGLAKFTQVWLLKNNEWKMSDILSYDHGPANRKLEIKLSEGELKEFEGNYKNPKFGTFNYKIQGSNLLVSGTGFNAVLYPESKNKFFIKERDLEFEFVRNEKNQVFKILVHEKGAVVDELLKF
ncbi:MAG TPA: nuclear transport factor 2 family protein [Daejeonella sp.]|uniref:nuclear transport factor 2 family protein n=1 Tax=Daejeonella sp. TaxID=2805397 RepID=UPI002EDA07D6